MRLPRSEQTDRQEEPARDGNHRGPPCAGDGNDGRWDQKNEKRGGDGWVRCARQNLQGHSNGGNNQGSDRQRI
jgi:hypothetical protein